MFSRKGNTNTKQFIEYFNLKHYEVIIAARKEMEWHMENNKSYIMGLIYNIGSK